MSRRLSDGPVTVDVPASSANLGAGFDVLGLALELSDIITVQRAPDAPAGSIAVHVEGEGAERLPSDGSDAFSRALREGLAELGATEVPGAAWRVRMQNAIPLGRGLGSSAAAIVGGLAAADLLAGGGVITPRRMLDLAAAAEGHADNAAAALHGGFTVAVRTAAGTEVQRFEPPAGLLAVLFIPDLVLGTGEMRGVLPDSVPRADAIHNVGRAAMTVAAMASGRLDLLGVAMDDRLHEPYRAAVYPELPGLLAAARRAGALGACLSGAGSSALALVEHEGDATVVAAALDAEARDRGLGGRVMVVRPRSQGVIGIGPQTS